MKKYVVMVYFSKSGYLPVADADSYQESLRQREFWSGLERDALILKQVEMPVHENESKP